MRTRSAVVALLCVAGCAGRVSEGGDSPDDTPAPRPGDVPAPAPASGTAMDLSSGRLGDLCKTPTFGRARLWRLSRDQIRNTLKQTLGLDASAAQLAAFNDGTGLLFRTEADSLRIHKTDAASWSLSAADLARTAVAAIKKMGVCPDPASAACAPVLVDAIGARLFRRPLRTEEKARYAKLYTDTLAAAMAGGDAAVEAVLSALLQSPYFLYRTELGRPAAGKPGVARLTGYEVASALSYTLWQSSPDDELMRAAGAGELDAAAGLRKQATRMIADARFHAFYAAELADLTHASQTQSREGADTVPNAANVMAWMQSELDAYVDAVLADKPTLDELLTRRRVSMPGDLVAYRNLGTGKGAALVAVDLPAPVAGLLSLGAVGFANAGIDHPSPVRRGVMVRERLLCAPVPPPPDSVKMQFAATGGDVVTNRQRYEKTMSPDLCNACHRLFNPIGYAFEAFDQLGKYRTQDGGRPVDLSGMVVETRDANVSFANLTELARGLAGSQQVAECFVLQGFRYVSGRLESTGDLCFVSQIHDAFARGGRDLRTLAVELVASDAFVFRSSEATP